MQVRMLQAGSSRSTKQSIRQRCLETVTGTPEKAVQPGSCYGPTPGSGVSSFNHTRDRKSLATSGDSQQHLIFRTVTEAANESLDRLRLITLRSVVRLELEAHKIDCKW